LIFLQCLETENTIVKAGCLLVQGKEQPLSFVMMFMDSVRMIKSPFDGEFPSSERSGWWVASD